MAKKKNRNPYKPKNIELKGAPSKFYYEYDMFIMATEANSKLRHDHPDIQSMINNVTLESLLVHARNLLDFFCGNTTDADDIRAFHFIPGSPPWRSSKLSYLSSLKKDINKYLSHLTYSRVIKKKPNWNWGRIRKEVEAAHEEFIKKLPDSEKANWRA